MLVADKKSHLQLSRIQTVSDNFKFNYAGIADCHKMTENLVPVKLTESMQKR